MKKIKTFTMLEALISLILTGIIIALSYSLFTLVNKQMALFEKENTEVINYNLFNTTLTLDIHRSNDFSFEDNRLILKNYTKPDIIYYFEGTAIKRTVSGLNTDTFKITTFSKDFLWSESDKPNELTLTVKLLNDSIRTNYFLKRPMSSIINKTLFNED